MSTEHQNRIIHSNIESLKQQSRSFAIPILKLDFYLQKPIMAEYNLNKSIDTIEDSLVLDADEKKYLIDEFCNSLSNGTISNIVKKRMLDITPEKEKFVFKNYAATIHLYNSLNSKEKYLTLSKTMEMAHGMKYFLDHKINTMDDLNEYCYYVAGTVGLYLVELMHLHHSYDSSTMTKQQEQALGFGRFLQKLNIIRDFQEDQLKNQGSFWPQEILNNYPNKKSCLNFLCHDTLLKDVKSAINFYKDLPEYNKSFDSFIKFILFSGLEYIKILRNNSQVFSKIKVKLPKLAITSLYKRICNLNKDKFLKSCYNILEQELEVYKVLLLN